MTEEMWLQVKDTLFASRMAPLDQLRSLRRVSHNMAPKCKHLRELMPFFEQAEDRQDLVVMLWLRLGDIHNEKMILPKLSAQDEVALNRRIGEICIFPFIQISYRQFELNLAK